MEPVFKAHRHIIRVCREINKIFAEEIDLVRKMHRIWIGQLHCMFVLHTLHAFVNLRGQIWPDLAVVCGGGIWELELTDIYG